MYALVLRLRLKLFTYVIESINKRSGMESYFKCMIDMNKTYMYIVYLINVDLRAYYTKSWLTKSTFHLSSQDTNQSGKVALLNTTKSNFSRLIVLENISFTGRFEN